MFPWKHKQHDATADLRTVGLAVFDGEVTAIAVDGEIEGHPHAIAWETIQIDRPADLQIGLKKFVDKYGLENWSCRCTLSPDDYSLRLVERPANVPDDELVDATRWLVRDLIEFDVEQAGLTILMVPEDSSRARTPRMFVVAAKHENLFDLGHAIEGSGLSLAGFEIVESSMLALESRMPGVVAGTAALRIHEKSSALTLAHNQHLYLARNLHVDADAIDGAAQHALNDPSPNNPEVLELLDPLLLDIQRSLDYYESEYGQAGASRLTLLPSHVELTPLIPALAEALRPIQVETYDLPHYFDFDDQPPTNMHPNLAVAGGAAVADPNLLNDALLPNSFRGADTGFGLASVLRIAGTIALITSAYAGMSWHSLGQERDVLTGLEIHTAKLRSELESLRAEAATRAAAANPRAQIEALRVTRDGRLKLLRDLGQQGSQSTASFSSLLAGLARQAVEGIWLERIEFGESGQSIAIEGRTLNPDAVPTFLRRLGIEKSFAGRNFRTFEIARQGASTPGLAFRVATRGRDEASDGGVQ